MASTSKQHGEGHLAPIGIADDVIVLVDSLMVKLENVTPLLFGRQCCIHRVPERLRKLNERAYTPEMVSIGPYHHGEKSLLAMEEYKMRYMHALLTRTTTIELSIKLKECFDSIKRIEQEARKCYSESLNLSEDEFVEMMVLDGLFIIELFRRKVGEVITNEYDPLINNMRVIWTLVCDLVKLENQLPMVVLNCLFNLSTLREDLQGSSNITILALKFFNTLMPRDADVLEKHSNFGGKHLLDLLGNTFVALPVCAPTETNFWKYIPSAVELEYNGIKFKRILS